MKILVTGGCGFLGTNISERILIENIGELFIIDDLSRVGSQLNLTYLENKGLKNFYKIDITSFSEINNLINQIKPDFIFHLAGQVAMTTSIENPRRDFEVNASGTLNLLEAIRLNDLKSSVIYSSTNKVYGDLENFKYRETPTRYEIDEITNGFDENIPLSFHSPYGCSKGTADQYLLDYYRIYGINTVVFRHSSMYGGRQFSSFDQGWVGWFCQKALEIKEKILLEPFSISGNGKQVRDLLFASDAVDIYILSMLNIDKLKGQAFNIGGGVENSFSLLELFGFLENELNIKMEYVEKPVRESDQKIFVANYNLFSSITGWMPKISKEQGVRLNLNWVMNNFK